MSSNSPATGKEDTEKAAGAPEVTGINR